MRALLKLGRQEGLPDRAKERIGIGTDLFKSMAGRKPTLGGLFEATATMARDASSSSAEPAPPPG